MRRFALLAVLAAVLVAGADARAQTPDNTGTRLDTSGGAGSPGYDETLKQREREELEGARKDGRSNMPILTGAPEVDEPQPVSPLDAHIQPEPAKADQEPPVETEPVPVQRVRQEEDVAAPEPAVVPVGDDGGGLDELVAALVKAMDRGPDIRRVVYGRPEAGSAGPREPVWQRAGAALPRVGAGDAFYGRVLHAVNSDYPGPVLIELLQPPLRGAVARGSFQLVGDRLVIRITALDVAGETVPVDAVAVGLDCDCFGVSGEVSYHWWDRLILPAAFGFVQQYLVARAQTERRVVQVEGGAAVTEQREASARQARDAGVAAAAGRAGEVLLEQAPSAQTVEIPANSEVAVMFAERLERRQAPAVEGPPETVPARVERVRASVSGPVGER
ncbi:MAG: hypothetical protein F4X35_10660 [Alphaproteobacteria bacterium]|nr:hypothetical protein [Alphaproteobacteria bacterium]